MLPTPTELREQARLYREAAREADDPSVKLRLARYALALAQVAELLDTGGESQRVRIQQFGRVLGEALGDEPRRLANTLLTAQPKTPYTLDQIKRWRLRAEELRTTADHFTTPSAQSSLRISAANYDRLADDAEAQLMGRPPAPKGEAG